MAIEEIILSVPQSLPTQVAAEDMNPDDRVVRRYRGLLQDQYRFAWTQRGRRKRQEAFEVAYRSLAKQLASEVTGSIEDRAVKLDTRTRIYVSLTGMLAVASAEQRRLRDQTRRLFGWGLTLFGIGLGSLAATVYLVI